MHQCYKYFYGAHIDIILKHALFRIIESYFEEVFRRRSGRWPEGRKVSAPILGLNINP